MAKEKQENIYKKCRRCKGTGESKEPNPSGGEAIVPCPVCDGAGEVLWGKVVRETPEEPEE